MQSSARSLRLARPIAAVLLLAIEPYALVALLLGVVAATFALASRSPGMWTINAALVPLEMAVACWLASARLERRARAEEFLLVELLLRLKGDFARAFPWRVRTTRERVEAKTPLPRLAAQDLLELARETPCRATRVVIAWVALVLASTPVAQWAWHAHVRLDTTSLGMVLLIGVCATPFAITWNDLRKGCLRILSDPRRVRRWSDAYDPAPTPTHTPCVPMLVILFAPAGSLGASWATGGSLSNRLNVTEAVFTFWLLAWNGRSAVTSSAFKRAERLSAPVDRLICRSITPLWDLLSRTCQWSGWGSAAVLALALSWPVAARQGTGATLADVSAWLLTLSLMLGALMLSHWRRPVDPRTSSAQELVQELGESQVRRITVCLNVAFATNTLLLALLGGLIG